MPIHHRSFLFAHCPIARPTQLSSCKNTVKIKVIWKGYDLLLGFKKKKNLADGFKLKGTLTQIRYGISGICLLNHSARSGSRDN
jgi:hypothetical protein